LSTPNLKAISVLLFGLFVALPTVAKDVVQNDPQLNERAKQLYASFDRPDRPGCAIGVFREGVPVLSQQFGVADLEHRVPITADSVFYIASLSKQFTAASIALLAHHQKLSFDDDIRLYLPEMPAYPNPITIRHLLHHISGVRDYQTLLGWAGRSIHDAHTDAELLSMLARQKRTSFAPGTRYEYSNSNYFLLALIVQRVSGISLRDYARKNIFEPLGMSRTEFRDDRNAVIRDRAAGYSTRNGAVIAVASLFDRVGDGGVMTTVGDLYRWDNNFYENRLPGGAALMRQMASPGSLNDKSTVNYGFGLALVEHNGWKVVGHSGAFDGYSADMMRLPELHMTAVTLCNTDSIDARFINNGLVDLIAPPKSVAKQSNPPPVPAPAAPAATVQPASLGPVELEVYAGDYWSDELEMKLTLAAQNGSLLLRTNVLPQFNLAATSKDRFHGGPVVIEFTRGASGKVEKAIVDGPGLTGMLFEKRDAHRQ